jgi:hypothetical protein
MHLGSIFHMDDELAEYTREARAVIEANGGPGAIRRIGSFFGNLGDVFRLITQEPEILLFAALQWAVIAAGYLCWVQALDWIPDSVWEEVARAEEQNRDSGFDFINFFLIGWSFAVVAAASFPLAILNAAMVAVHGLRHDGYDSTIVTALRMGFRNIGKQWAFTTADAWITVTAILDRLPKKRGPKRTAMDELLYYAWKLATMGMVPAMVHGRGIIDAAKDSVRMIKGEPGRAIAIRFGYSGLCWILGILTYAGSIAFFSLYGHDIEGAKNEIFNFYFLMAVPICISVGVIMVLVRPFFLLMVAKLYTEVINPKVSFDPQIMAENAGGQEEAAISPYAIGFLAGCLILAVILAAVYANDLGLTDWVDSLAAKDFAKIEAKP